MAFRTNPSLPKVTHASSTEPSRVFTAPLRVCRMDGRWMASSDMCNKSDGLLHSPSQGGRTLSADTVPSSGLLPVISTLTGSLQFSKKLCKVPDQRFQGVQSRALRVCDSVAINISTPPHTGYLLSLCNVHSFVNCHLSKRWGFVCLFFKMEMTLCFVEKEVRAWLVLPSLS